MISTVFDATQKAYSEEISTMISSQEEETTIQPFMTPEQRRYQEVMKETALVQKAHLRERFERRWQKAVASGNEPLIRQLKEEYKTLQ